MNLQRSTARLKYGELQLISTDDLSLSAVFGNPTQ